MRAFRIINARSLKVTQSHTVLVEVHLKQKTPCKFAPKFCIRIGMQDMHAWVCMSLRKRFSTETFLSQLKHVDSESDLGLEPYGQELARF